MAGTMSLPMAARTYTVNRLNPMLMHVMAGEQETGRSLLTPDEAMRLPDDAALIFVAGHPPIYGQKIRYYQDPVFSERARPASARTRASAGAPTPGRRPWWRARGLRGSGAV